MSDVFRNRVPYGYRMENGKIVIHPEEAERLKTFFEADLSGATMRDAGKMAGLNCSTDSYPNIIERTIYVGNSHYPAMISEEYHRRLMEEREKRTKRKPRRKMHVPQKIRIQTEFWFLDDLPTDDVPADAVMSCTMQTAGYIHKSFPDFQKATDANAYCGRLYSMIQRVEKTD